MGWKKNCSNLLLLLLVCKWVTYLAWGFQQIRAKQRAFCRVTVTWWKVEIIELDHSCWFMKQKCALIIRSVFVSKCQMMRLIKLPRHIVLSQLAERSKKQAEILDAAAAALQNKLLAAADLLNPWHSCVPLRRLRRLLFFRELRCRVWDHDGCASGILIGKLQLTRFA